MINSSISTLVCGQAACTVQYLETFDSFFLVETLSPARFSRTVPPIHLFKFKPFGESMKQHVNIFLETKQRHSLIFIDFGMKNVIKHFPYTYICILFMFSKIYVFMYQLYIYI